MELTRHPREVREGIPIFTDHDAYWGHIPRGEMQAAISYADSHGWSAAVDRFMPDYAQAVTPAYRADGSIALLPMTSSDRILDAGCGGGGVTIPLARRAGEVHAVDQTWESLRLMMVRCRDERITNVVPICSGLRSLPYPDDSFDGIVVNGVLEWVAVQDTMTVADDWAGRQTARRTYADDPMDVQRDVLRELRRVLSPNGVLYLAIENRHALHYWFGYRDDHVNVPFVTVLPRWAANGLTRIVRNSDYRTYTYSPHALTALLQEAGFPTVTLHAVCPQYQHIGSLVPFDGFTKRAALAFDTDDWRVTVFKAIWGLLPATWMRQTAPCLVAVAR